MGSAIPTGCHHKLVLLAPAEARPQLSKVAWGEEFQTGGGGGHLEWSRDTWRRSCDLWLTLFKGVLSIQGVLYQLCHGRHDLGLPRVPVPQDILGMGPAFIA